jgi:hypothetical protein
MCNFIKNIHKLHAWDISWTMVTHHPLLQHACLLLDVFHYHSQRRGAVETCNKPLACAGRMHSSFLCVKEDNWILTHKRLSRCTQGRVQILVSVIYTSPCCSFLFSVTYLSCVLVYLCWLYSWSLRYSSSKYINNNFMHINKSNWFELNCIINIFRTSYHFRLFLF